MMVAKGSTWNPILVALVSTMSLFYIFYSPQLLASDLGRLFTTPVERHLLDKSRRENSPLIDSTASNGAAKKEAKTMVYNGVVTRSNGDRQIWIDGKIVNGRKGPDGIRIHKGPDRDHRVTLSVPGKHKRVKVKPGQSWSLESGKVVDFRDVTSSSAVDTVKP
jgi:hypothetical protein